MIVCYNHLWKRNASRAFRKNMSCFASESWLWRRGWLD